MDAAYIRETVHMPLMEGLLAAVISNPIDKVDFLGNYLINYIQKKNDDILKQKEINNAEELAKLEKIYELNEIREIELKKQADEMKLQKFHSYLTYDLMKFSNKQEIMNSICTFASEHLLIPACYIAERKINDDKDILEYIAANPSQSAIVLGKSIQNSSTDVEVAERSGISFEAFKMKEIDLEAITNDEDIDGEEEVEDGDEEKMPKKAFKPRPLIVDNVMRDKRVKFFGASKLGSFFAIPLELQSSAYEGGCVKAETQEVEDEEEQKEEGEETNDAEDSESFKNEMDKTESRPVYKAVTEKREFLFAADTIGQFHQFQVNISAHIYYFKLRVYFPLIT